jgi:predicted small metal-binding protein
MAREFECYQSGCEFMVRADTAEEVVRLVREHAREQHGLTLDREDIEAAIEQS